MVDLYQAPPRAHTNGQHSPKRFAFTRSIQRVFMNKTRSRRLPVDIYLYKPSEGRPYTYVQYKAWGSRKVGVEPVRAFRVMAADKIPKGYFVCTGEYSSDARTFGENNALDLITGAKLVSVFNELHEAFCARNLIDITKEDYPTLGCPPPV